MLIPKSIIKAISPEGISGMYIKSPPEMRQELKEFMHNTFDSEWYKACINVKTKYGNCYDLVNGWPSGIDIYDWEFGLYITLPALYILYDEGMKSDSEFANIAFQQTMDLLKNQYPAIRYFGYVAFIDLQNNVIQKEIISTETEHVERYEFIANAMEYINQNTDAYLDVMLNCCYSSDDSEWKWIFELLDFFHLYEDKVGFSIYEKIMYTVSEYIEDDDIYNQLEEKIDEWKKEAGITRYRR